MKAKPIERFPGGWRRSFANRDFARLRVRIRAAAAYIDIDAGRTMLRQTGYGMGMNIEALFGGDRDQLAAERAIAEFRAGRPVLIETATAPSSRARRGTGLPALAVLEGFAQGAARLVLSGARLHIGAPRAARSTSSGRRHRAAGAAGAGEIAAIDAPVLPLGPGEEAALQLTHLAAPAAGARRRAAGAMRSPSLPVARVAAAAILAYRGTPGRRPAHRLARAIVPLEGAPKSGIRRDFPRRRGA